MPPLPDPHGAKLRALLRNAKLPPIDAEHVKVALERYERWLESLDGMNGADSGFLSAAVGLLNEYRLFLDLEVIFDSTGDFLYRQKGQLKLDNTVIEEFLPRVLIKALGSQISGLRLGPQSCYSAMYFSSTLATAHLGPGSRVRSKDQDFAIARTAKVSVSFDGDQREEVIRTAIGYLCAECKTNLDKTMFQEAIATAHDVKMAAPGAKYILLCEWLDMTPMSPAGTDIDEILIFRKAKRIGAQARSRFATKAGRVAAREEYERFLRAHPFSVDVFERLLTHVRGLLENRDLDERDALAKGYF